MSNTGLLDNYDRIYPDVPLEILEQMWGLLLEQIEAYGYDNDELAAAIDGQLEDMGCTVHDPTGFWLPPGVSEPDPQLLKQ